MAIKILSDELVALIAAGEVIERPYSVVKELVENALDAGAKNITVELKKGGIKSIKVVDDGHGIAADELDLAFQRFATSKFSEGSAVGDVETLGFRGEALPSIASVGDVEMVTRAADTEHGTRYVVTYGEFQTKEPCGAPFGTSVTVNDIFHKTPARFKFLSSAAYESGRIQRLVHALATINTAVGFKLVLDDKLRFSSLGQGDQMAVLARIYTSKITDSLLAVDETIEGIAIKGTISAPNVRRSNRVGIILGLNGRLIQDRLLMVAIKQAYRGYLDERTFPIATLCVSVPTNSVDVNVHPAKSEVRFADKDRMFSAVQNAVRRTLIEKAGVPEFKRFSTQPATDTASAPTQTPNYKQTAPASQSPASDWTPGWPAPDTPIATDNAENAQNLPSNFTHREILPLMQFVGQIQKTYLVADTLGGMYLIDQHAAHERVTFDAIVGTLKTAGRLEIQPLLAPETVELPADIISFLDEHRAKLEKFGFQLEQFGENTILIRSVPALLVERGTRDITELITNILTSIAEGKSGEQWQRDIIATIACHSSIRAGHTMGADESHKLLQQLAETEQPQTCPHGRPTVIHISNRLIEREFERS